MDAPFGQLDNHYQEKISELLPTLSDQLCRMLSEVRHEVFDKLEPYGGRQYLIVRHNKADNQNDGKKQSLKRQKYSKPYGGKIGMGHFLNRVNGKNRWYREANQ